MLDRLLANWPLKLLALVLAFAIWVSVTGESRILQDFQVPLEIRVGDGLVLASPSPTTVNVRLRGLESQMRRLDPVPLVMRVDLGDVAPGQHDVLLSAEDLQAIPRGMEVEFVTPDRVQVLVDRRLRRELPIEPTLLGQPDDGFALYSADVRPLRRTVEGPETVMNGLEVLRTAPIRLEGRKAAFTTRVAVIPDSSLVRLIDSSPVEVRVIVDSRAVERRLEGLPVTVAGGSAQLTVSPPTLDVTLSGPAAVLDDIDASRIRLIAETAGRTVGRTPQNVDVRVEFVDISADQRARIVVSSISRQRVSLRSSSGS